MSPNQGGVELILHEQMAGKDTELLDKIVDSDLVGDFKHVNTLLCRISDVETNRAKEQ